MYVNWYVHNIYDKTIDIIGLDYPIYIVYLSLVLIVESLSLVVMIRENMVLLASLNCKLISQMYYYL